MHAGKWIMATSTRTRTRIVLHIAHAFSAEPTLSIALQSFFDRLRTDDVENINTLICEKPFDEAIVWPQVPDLVWFSDPSVHQVGAIRTNFPQSSILATVPSVHSVHNFTALINAGADLVFDDNSVVCAAAALTSLMRRPRATEVVAVPA